MTQVLGLILIVTLVAGALAMTGTDVVLASLPLEIGFIAGSAFATLLIGNSSAVVRNALAGLVQAVRGPTWTREDFADLLVTLDALLSRRARGGALAIEADIEEPDASDLFASASRLQRDPAVRDLICEALRIAGTDLSKPDRALDHMAGAIDRHMSERRAAVSALMRVSDALPALGIVAAVIGIIKTMAAIDASTAVIGAMIATALSGTFLGVFLAYGIVSPLAGRFAQTVDADAVAFDVVESVLSQALRGTAVALAVEMGRLTVPAERRPASARLVRSGGALPGTADLKRVA